MDHTKKKETDRSSNEHDGALRGTNGTRETEEERKRARKRERPEIVMLSA